MARGNNKHTWGRLDRVSKNGNVIANLIQQSGIGLVTEEDLPDDLRDPENKTFIKSKYKGVSVYLKKVSNRDQRYEPIDPKPEWRLPEFVSEPVYWPSRDVIILDFTQLHGREDGGWQLPEVAREESIEWDGNKQNVGAVESDERSTVFGEDDIRGDRNDLLDGNL